MMIARISLLMIICCLAGCGGKKTSKQAEIDQSHATVYYQEQESKRRQLDGAGTTVRHQKEIDVENIVFDQVAYDHVWIVDVPVPLAAVEIPNYCKATSDVYTIGYRAPEDQEELVPFYKQQMELLGWQCAWETAGLEALLMFEKSHKHCAVSIRPSSSRKRKTDIIIMQKTV